MSGRGGKDEDTGIGFRSLCRKIPSCRENATIVHSAGRCNRLARDSWTGLEPAILIDPSLCAGKMPLLGSGSRWLAKGGDFHVDQSRLPMWETILRAAGAGRQECQLSLVRLGNGDCRCSFSTSRQSGHCKTCSAPSCDNSAICRNRRLVPLRPAIPGSRSPGRSASPVSRLPAADFDSSGDFQQRSFRRNRDITRCRQRFVE